MTNPIPFEHFQEKNRNRTQRLQARTLTFVSTRQPMDASVGRNDYQDTGFYNV
jgi:hypothetical protein